MVYASKEYVERGPSFFAVVLLGSYPPSLVGIVANEWQNHRALRIRIFIYICYFSMVFM
jgi:hypothetical protein